MSKKQKQLMMLDKIMSRTKKLLINRIINKAMIN